MLVLSSSQLLVIGERQRVRWREDRRGERGSGTCAKCAERKAEWKHKGAGWCTSELTALLFQPSFLQCGSKYNIKFYFKIRKRQLLEFLNNYIYSSSSSSSVWTDVDTNDMVLTLLPTRKVLKNIIIVLSESFVLWNDTVGLHAPVRLQIWVLRPADREAV